MQETQETGVRSLGQEDPLEKEMATHSSILAWAIPLAEEPGRFIGFAKCQTRPKQLSTWVGPRHWYFGNISVFVLVWFGCTMQLAGSLWDFSSPIRDRTQALSSESEESQLLDH